MTARSVDLAHIKDALRAAVQALRPFTPGRIAADLKYGDDPVTLAHTAVDELLNDFLPRDGEGWLSEETADDRARLDRDRVWVVDPIDGTQEFVQGIPEWVVSIALVEDGRPVAGGIVNPALSQYIIGSMETGVTINGSPTRVRWIDDIDGIEVLASRSEVRRGEWDGLVDGPVRVRPCGSVAYKMALVAAGRADATWTLSPKHEWDVAAGTALVLAAGGTVLLPDGSSPRFNRPDTLLPGLVATPPGIAVAVKELIGLR